MHGLITANLWMSAMVQDWQNATFKRYWLLTVLFGLLCFGMGDDDLQVPEDDQSSVV